MPTLMKNETQYTFSVSTSHATLAVTVTENELINMVERRTWMDEFDGLFVVLKRMSVRGVELKVVAQKGHTANRFQTARDNQIFRTGHYKIEAISHDGNVMTWDCALMDSIARRISILATLMEGVLPGGEFRRF